MQSISARNLKEYSAENYVNISAKLRKTYTGIFVDFLCETFEEYFLQILANFSVHLSCSSSIGTWEKNFMQSISAKNLTEYSAENYVNISAKLWKTYKGIFVDFLCEAFAEYFLQIFSEFFCTFFLQQFHWNMEKKIMQSISARNLTE